MRLHYYVDPRGNFGDDLNAVVWPGLVGDLLDDDGRSLLVGTGTLLNGHLPRGPLKAVLGSGVGYGALPTVDASWSVYCVRGPLSAAALGLDPGLAVTDSALLVRLVDPPPAVHGGIVFMPHHTTLLRAAVEGRDLTGVCEQLGVRLLDPATPVREALAVLRGAELVLADAMHAAIVADAFRVPWVALSLYDHVDEAKWRDWCLSLRLSHSPVRRTHDGTDDGTDRSFARCLQAAMKAPATLSSDLDSDRALARLQECVARFGQDVRGGRLTGHGRTGWEPDPVPSAARSWHDDLVAAARRAAGAATPTGAVAMAGTDEWLVDRWLDRRRVLPLDALGPPADDLAAARQLAAARAAGAEVLVLTASSAWWLQAYPSISSQLARPPVVADEFVSVYRFRRGPA